MLKSKMGPGKFLVVVLVLSSLSLTNGVRPLPELKELRTLMPFHISHPLELQTWNPPSLHDDTPAIPNIPLCNKTEIDETRAQFDEIFKKRQDMEYLYPTQLPPVQRLLEIIKKKGNRRDLLPSVKLTRTARRLLRRILRLGEHIYLSKSDEAKLKRLYKRIRTTPSPSV